MANAIVEQVRAIDPDVPVYDIATMQQRVHDSVARQRFAMTMLGAFACFAMILAAIGVYGVMSFLVTQGTSDIAIRMALGAQRDSILSLVFRQGMGLALIGIAVGLVGAVEPDACDERPALRRERNRPADLCGSRGSADVWWPCRPAISRRDGRCAWIRWLH